MMLTPYTFAVAIAPIPPARAMPEPTLCVKTTARPTTSSNLLISSLLFDALDWELLVTNPYARHVPRLLRAMPKAEASLGRGLSQILDRQILPSGLCTLEKGGGVTESCVVDLTVTLSSG